jgi:iron complex outermembrane receptor protein
VAAVTLIAIDRVHGQGTLPPVTVEATKAKKARPPQKKAKAVLGVVLVEPPRTAAAVSSGAAFKSTLDLDAATTAGSRLPGTARDVPASAETINQATMQERGKETWVDALQGLAGFTSAVRPGASGVMSARGFTENGFALLYDGVRVSSTTISSRVYDSFIFDRIDVLRGPASVLYGEGAVGGAINLIHKEPSRERQPFETLTSFSSLDGFRLGLGTGGPIGDSFSYRLDGVIHNFDGPVDGNEIEYGTLAGAFKWQINSKLSSTVDFDLMRTRIEDAYWGTPLVKGRIDSRLRDVNYNNLPNNKYDDDVAWARWKVDYEASSNLKFRNQLWSYQADRDWINTYRFVHIPAGGKYTFRGNTIENTTGSDKVYRLTWENLGYDHSFVGDRFDGTWTGTLGGMKASAVMGVEVGRTRWDSPRSETTSPQPLDPFNPEPTDFFDHGTGRAQNVLAELGQSSAFGEGRLEVVPGVTLVGGFRKDWLQVDYERQSGTSPDQVYDANYQPGTYRVGALWNIWRGTTLYAQYATAVEPRFALFTLGAGDTVFTLTEAKQVEVGVKQSFDNGRGELVAALYHIDKTNIPSVDPTGATVQVGEQSSKGVELAASWRPTDALRFDANIAFVDARYEDYSTSSVADFTGNRPPNVPDTVANLGVSWKTLPLLTVGGWLHYHSSIMADDTNTVSLPGAVIADVFASYQVAPAADLTFRVHNLTDEVYAAWATDANYVILGAPRTYSLTLRTRF